MVSTRLAALTLSAVALLAASTLLLAGEPSSPVPSKAAIQWWADISALAGDGMEGRMTGSAAYLRAADYVIARFKADAAWPRPVWGAAPAKPYEAAALDAFVTQVRGALGLP